jgi:uncharacterized membrane protein
MIIVTILLGLLALVLTLAGTVSLLWCVGCIMVRLFDPPVKNTPHPERAAIGLLAVVLLMSLAGVGYRVGAWLLEQVAR